jgi:hypothetical protein
MSKVASAFILLILLSFLSICLTFASSLQWPPAKRGTWELTAKRALVGGKAQNWKRTTRQCVDPSLMFRGYWGLGAVDKAGCQFESQRVPDGGFKITSKCPMTGDGISTSAAVVTLNTDDAFEMHVKVNEGNKEYIGDETGRWIKDCDAAEGQ